MKTLEQLDQEHAAERARLVREHEFAKTLPVPPKFVISVWGRVSAYYEVETVEQAKELFKKFEHVKASVNRNGSTTSMVAGPDYDHWYEVSRHSQSIRFLIKGAVIVIQFQEPLGVWYKDHPRARVHFKWLFRADGKFKLKQIVNYGDIRLFVEE